MKTIKQRGRLIDEAECPALSSCAVNSWADCFEARPVKAKSGLTMA